MCAYEHEMVRRASQTLFGDLQLKSSHGSRFLNFSSETQKLYPENQATLDH